MIAPPSLQREREGASAKTSPTGMRAVSGTGFSREEAGVHAGLLAQWHSTLSRLSQSHGMHAVSGTGFSREEAGVHAGLLAQ